MTVRYGVIGSGMMGIEHINNIAVLDGAEVVAIADPDERSRTLGLAAAGTATNVFSDYRALLDWDGCDAVVIATPNHTHAQILLDALATDLHVLVEKPLCSTVEDCQKVLAAAEGRPGIVWVGLEYRYMPPIARLLAEVRAGAVGSVRMVAIREHRFPFLVKVGNWNRFSRYTGGTLVEKACHFFDLMNLVTGAEPVRVMASGGQDVNHLDEEYEGERPDMLDNAYVIVEYDSGARALLDLCMFAEGSKNEQEIAVTGDRGKVEAFVPEGTVRIGSRDTIAPEEELVEDDRIRYPGLHHGSSYLEHLDFLAAVTGGRAPAVGLEAGLRAVAVGAAAHRSIAEGRPISVSEVLGV